MDGEAVARARIALHNEIHRTDALVRALRFQEAEENLPAIESLNKQLAQAVNPDSEVHNTIIRNARIRISALSKAIESGLRRRQAGKKDDGNIAFKCNWNDKNYKAVCSESAHQYNRIHGGPWCLYSRCRQFVTLQTPPVGADCCYESRALIDCSFGAGWDHGPHGEPIRPRTIRSARPGKVALLTTQPPYSQDRLLVGAFKIARVVEDPGKEMFICGDRETLVGDMLEYGVRFWKYHRNPRNRGSEAWSTGLFRYVSDVAVLGMLEEYIANKHRKSADVGKGERLLGALRGLASH